MALKTIEDTVQNGPPYIKKLLETQNENISTQDQTQPETSVLLFNLSDVYIPASLKGSKSKSKLAMEIEKYSFEPAKIQDPSDFWRVNSATYPGLFYCVKHIMYSSFIGPK